MASNPVDWSAFLGNPEPVEAEPAPDASPELAAVAEAMGQLKAWEVFAVLSSVCGGVATSLTASRSFAEASAYLRVARLSGHFAIAIKNDNNSTEAPEVA